MSEMLLRHEKKIRDTLIHFQIHVQVRSSPSGIRSGSLPGGVWQVITTQLRIFDAFSNDKNLYR